MYRKETKTCITNLFEKNKNSAQELYKILLENKLFFYSFNSDERIIALEQQISDAIFHCLEYYMLKKSIHSLDYLSSLLRSFSEIDFQGVKSVSFSGLSTPKDNNPLDPLNNEIKVALSRVAIHILNEELNKAKNLVEQ